jgi:hypothetical protein
LDMIIGHIILQIKKVLPFGVLLLEGWDGLISLHGRTMCKIVCHVIFIMWMVTLIHLRQLFLLALNVCCVGNLQESKLIYNQCFKAWHLGCCTWLLKEVLVEK